MNICSISPSAVCVSSDRGLLNKTKYMFWKVRARSIELLTNTISRDNDSSAPHARPSYTDRRRRQSSQAPALESSCSAHSTGSPRTYRKCAGAQLFCFRAVRRAPFVEHARCNTAPLEHTAATHLNFLRNPLSPRGTNPPPLVKQMNLFCAAAFPL